MCYQHNSITLLTLYHFTPYQLYVQKRVQLHFNVLYMLLKTSHTIFETCPKSQEYKPYKLVVVKETSSSLTFATFPYIQTHIPNHYIVFG